MIDAPPALPLARDPVSAALAGTSVLVARRGSAQLRVSAVPAIGGDGTPVFSFRAPAGWDVSIRLAASPSRAVASVERSRVTDLDSDVVQTFIGPALGPWTALGPLEHDNEAAFPLREQVEGDTVFTTVARPGDGEATVVVRDPNPRELPLPGGASSAIFAGDLVAYEVRKPTEDRPLNSSVVLANWHTGAIQRVVEFPDGIDLLQALRPDGRFAVTLGENVDVYDVRPGHSPQRLTHNRGFPALNPARYAASTSSFASITAYACWTPMATCAPLERPPHSSTASPLTTRACCGGPTDCLMIAPVTAPAARTPVNGPCPRSEIELDNSADAKLARTLPVRLHCVPRPRAAAARCGCAQGPHATARSACISATRSRLDAPGRSAYGSQPAAMPSCGARAARR